MFDPVTPSQEQATDSLAMHSIDRTPRAELSKAEAVHIIPFRKIMEASTSVERTKLFRQSRMQFAAIDTGLDEWLVAMAQKHPEHLNGPSPPGAGTQAEVPQVVQGQGQSPGPAMYAQQHNASSPGGLQHHIPPAPLGAHGAHTFAHQSKEVGTKSKELLKSAGKAGKGLLNKGKIKLRGTGDKVFFNS